MYCMYNVAQDDNGDDNGPTSVLSIMISYSVTHALKLHVPVLVSERKSNGDIQETALKSDSAM